MNKQKVAEKLSDVEDIKRVNVEVATVCFDSTCGAFGALPPEVMKIAAEHDCKLYVSEIMSYDYTLV